MGTGWKNQVVDFTIIFFYQIFQIVCFSGLSKEPELRAERFVVNLFNKNLISFCVSNINKMKIVWWVHSF